MKSYFKRLRQHAGLGTATMLTILCYLAAAGNKNTHSIWDGFILGTIAAAIIWLIVLLTVNKK